MASQYVSNTISATGTAASTTVDTEFICMIANDSTVGDLLISLQDDTSADYITLKPGEMLKNLELSVSKYWVKSSSGTVTGRFLALQR